MKTPEEMYYEWRQAFDESLDERMCKGEPIELQLLHRELGKETFLAGYKAAQDQVADVSKVMPQWISVKDRLPEELIRVLTYGCDDFSFSFIKDGSWTWIDDEGHIFLERDITHWMPLPAPPKEEE